MTTAAFIKHLSASNNSLFANAMRLTRNKHNAQDLMQETILRAFSSCQNFREGTNFKAWMSTIMKNCFINEYRKRQYQYKTEKLMRDERKGVVEQSVKNEGSTVVMMKDLRNILDDLCETNRIPFELHFNGFGYLEIAAELGIPLGTVKSRIFFARKKLKRMVEGQYGDQAQYA